MIVMRRTMIEIDEIGPAIQFPPPTHFNSVKNRHPHQEN
jgi:hypothetical protein